MITVKDAFKKFKSKLELTDGEQSDASRRQKDIRSTMDDAFDIDDDFLTGSYRRWTKTKPLKDVDIFCVLGSDERHYRDKKPGVLLDEVVRVLSNEYGKENVKKQRRSVSVSFGVTAPDDDSGGKVMSFDVVPAFAKDGHYEIPDTSTKSGWTETDPTVHYDRALAAQEAYSGEWKGLVRMVKKWNAHHEKPVFPSFLLEVMALEIFVPPYGGDHRFEVKAFFATAAERISEEWEDPAGLGPPVSDSMDTSARTRATARLREAENKAAEAIQLEKNGKTGEALRKWRELFGPLFPLS